MLEEAPRKGQVSEEEQKARQEERRRRRAFDVFHEEGGEGQEEAFQLWEQEAEEEG